MQQAAALVAQAASTVGDDLKTATAQAQSQVRRAVAQTLDQAERRGGQMAAETAAEAQQYVRQASAQAEQAVGDAKAVADIAARRIDEVQKLLDSLRTANLSAAARREATLALERMATDANAAVRLRAAQAMGELPDPVYLPALMALLSDQADVQTAAMASLAQIAGSDVTKREGGRALSDEERVRLWQLWYRQRQDARR
jgi:PBS lyase HEAT-like repeat